MYSVKLYHRYLIEGDTASATQINSWPSTSKFKHLVIHIFLFSQCCVKNWCICLSICQTLIGPRSNLHLLDICGLYTVKLTWFLDDCKRTSLQASRSMGVLGRCNSCCLWLVAGRPTAPPSIVQLLNCKTKCVNCDYRSSRGSSVVDRLLPNSSWKYTLLWWVQISI